MVASVEVPFALLQKPIKIVGLDPVDVILLVGK